MAKTIDKIIAAAKAGRRFQFIDDLKTKSILILGYPASGKSTLSDIFAFYGFTVTHTDDYIQYDAPGNGMAALKEAIKFTNFKNHVMEGIFGYQLLRDGEVGKFYRPDLIIEITPPLSVIESRYHAQRPEKDLIKVKVVIDKTQKLLRDYMQLTTSVPSWLSIQFLSDIFKIGT